MPVLERACYLATWCSAAGLRAAARRWLNDAFMLAAGPLVGHWHLPRALA